MTINEFLDALTAHIGALPYIAECERWRGQFGSSGVEEVSFTTPAVWVLAPEMETVCPVSGTLDLNLTVALFLVVEDVAVEDRETQAQTITQNLLLEIQEQRWGFSPDLVALPRLDGNALDSTTDEMAKAGLGAKSIIWHQWIRTGNPLPGIEIGR